MGLFGSLILGLYLWITSAAHRKWAQMEREVRALGTELGHFDRTRPVLQGETLPGNGWSDYETAELLAWKVWPDQALSAYRMDPKTSHLHALRRILQASVPLLDHLRKGVHHAYVKGPYAREDGLWMVQRQSRIWQAIYLLQYEGRLHRLDSRPQDALRDLLDALQATQDNPQPYLLEILGDLMLLLTEDSLSQEDLLVLETGLARAELNSNTGQWEGLEHLAHHGSLLVLGEKFLGDEWDVWPSWRYGFSLRLQQADAFLALVPLAKAQATLEGEKLKQFQEDWGSLHFGNRVAGHNFPRYQRSRFLWNDDLARLRLLRMGARFKRTGEILKLEDPWGDWIRYRVEGSEGKFWSLARDKEDNGGDGLFRPLPGKMSPDIVLSVRR